VSEESGLARVRQRGLAALGPLLGVALLTLAVLVLRREFQSYHLHDVVAHLRDIPARALALALVLTVLGYITLTGYDALAFRYVDNPLPYRRIGLASFVAYVFSHNVGLSFFGGSAVRYRMLSSWGVRADEIARIIAFALLTFWLGFLLLGGLAHSAWPLNLDLPWVPLSSSRPIGFALLGLLGAYLALVALRRLPLRFRGFEIEIPGLRMTAAQLALSTLDWLLAASVLYTVLPSSPGLGFPTFAGAYLLAVVVGLVSHVPGGLGVFETAMVLLLRPYLPGDQVLASVVAYRIVYYLLPLAVAVVLFAGYEVHQRSERIGRAGTTVQGWMSALAPRLFAVTTFLAGALLLFSGATPELPERLAWLRETLPLPLIEISKLLGSVFGVLLLLLANALRQRSDAAYYATLALLGGGIAASLLKGLDWEESAILAGMGVALLPCRTFFYRRSSLLAMPLSAGWWMAVSVVALGSVFALELAYRHVEYSNELWWRFAPDAQAPRSLRAMLAAGVALVAIGASRLLRPAPPIPDPPSREDLDRAQAIVARSPRVDGYLALLRDKELLFEEGGTAFLMFGVSGRTWVAMGDPIGPSPQQEALAWRFRELADRHGARAVFYEVSDAALPIYLDLGLGLRKLGEVGRVPLPGFSLEGRHRAGLRQARNRLGREGCRFELVASSEVPPLLDELEAVSDDWLRSKNTREKRFSLGFFDRDYLRRLPIGVVRQGDSLIGFANVWPSEARQECSIDLMRHRGDAPKGVMDFLFTELMLWARDEGYQWFSLGMAPLSGFEHHPLAPLWNRLGALLFRHGEHFYNFRGLREFKSKFDPEWEPRYLAAPGGLATPFVLTRIAGLVSGGVGGIVGR
jgi:phosphatidylglycerol lysyltransferase